MTKYIPKRAGNLFATVQKHLYDSLRTNEILSKDVKIFHQVPKDTAYPYIYIGKFSVISKATKDNNRMYFVNDVHLYSQDSSTEEILCWSNEIKEALNTHNVPLQGCDVVETCFLQMTMDIMPDSRVHKVSSKFRIIIEEKNGGLQWKLSAA
jgi:hypothetical protein